MEIENEEKRKEEEEEAEKKDEEEKSKDEEEVGKEEHMVVKKVVSPTPCNAEKDGKPRDCAHCSII